MSVWLVSAPTVSSLSSGGWFDLLLDTGNLASCAGIMQNGLETQGSSWYELYVNGNSCVANNYTTMTSISAGHNVESRVDAYSSSQTEFSMYDNNTGNFVYQLVSNLQTWSYNTIETMTESDSLSGTAGSVQWQDAAFDQSGYGYSVGGTGTSTPVAYGGVCSTSVTTFGSWSTSYYGFQEPSFGLEGLCTTGLNQDYTTYGQGQVHNEAYSVGFPNSNYAEIYGGNNGDGGSIYPAWASGQHSGELYIWGYSYNNGGGVAYRSWVIVKYYNGASWVQLSASYWNPSATNTGSWIDIGHVTNAEVVNITSIFYGGYSADIFVGAVAVH